MAIKKSRLLGAVCACAYCFIAVPSHAAFIGRLPTTSGGSDYQAYYDDQLDITWTANANINGPMIWTDALNWADGLNIDGVTGWRLPTMDVNGDNIVGDTNTPPFNGVVDCSTSTQKVCKDNEYGHLYYYGAGTTFGEGITSSSTVPFSNVADNYWSDTFWAITDGQVWIHNFTTGDEFTIEYDGEVTEYAWAVHDGDVVPIPAALWLFGSGLLCLVGMMARRKI